MDSATTVLQSATEASWQVSRDGRPVAVVAVGRDGGEVVVEAELEGSTTSPYRFDTLQAADAFVNDLIASFAYLGCDVART